MNATTLLDRRAVVRALLSKRGQAAVVSGLGSPTYDTSAAGDDDRNFYLWGAMGGTVMVGLGLALARPDVPVLVLTGDGDMLMGLASLATVATHNPANLRVAVIDNRRYGETGGQPSHTAHATDLAAVAAACGIAETESLSDMSAVDRLASLVGDVRAGCRLSVLAVDNTDHPRDLPSRDGAYLRTRFRQALGLSPS